MNSLTQISTNIKYYRKLSNITQKELAIKLHVSPQVISNFERGYTEPSATDVKKISEALNTSILDIYYTSDYNNMNTTLSMIEHEPIKKNSHDFGNRLKKFRIHKNLTQKDLANKINVNKSIMNRIEDNSRPIRSDEIIAIASILEISTDKLLGFSKKIITDCNNERTKQDLEFFLDQTPEIYYRDMKLTKKEKRLLKDMVSVLFLQRLEESSD